MNFDAIIRYQEIDSQRLKMMRDFNKSAEVAKRNAAEVAFDEAKNSALKSDSDAYALYAEFEKTTAELSAIEAEIQEYYGYIEGAKDIVEIEHYEKKVGELSDKMDAMLRDLERQSEACDRLDKGFKAVCNDIVAANKRLKDAMAAVAALQAKIAPELKAIIDELSAVGSTVDPELLKLYNEKRQSVKSPVFVQYGERGKFCRCGIEVPENVAMKLKDSGDLAACPNCGRVLFVK